VLEVFFYAVAQLCILQSLFEGREGIVVTATGRIMITDYNSRSRLEGFLHNKLSGTYLELRFYRL
jgi:hypothetical protein